MSLKELADKVNVSWPTIKKRYEDALEQNVIFKPVVHYDYRRIGLQRISIIAQISNYESLLTLEKACDIHPYTTFRSRIIGQKFGLFVQFKIPNGDQVLSSLNRFIEKLKESKIISSYTILPEEKLTHNIFPNLDRWGENKWDFSWNEWFNTINTDHGEIPNIEVEMVDFEDLIPIRLQILRHLTSDASTKQTDFMDILDLSRTEAHRHYKFVMDNLVNHVELLYDRSIFDLTDLHVYVVRNMDRDELNSIYHALSKNPPPFRFSISIHDENTLLMWGIMSTTLANEFGLELWKRYSDVKMYTASILKGSSINYWFYYKNFDFENKKWKGDHDYIVSQPLNELLK